MRTPMLIQASRFITTCEKKEGQSSKRAARKMENVPFTRTIGDL